MVSPSVLTAWYDAVECCGSTACVSRRLVGKALPAETAVRITDECKMPPIQPVALHAVLGGLIIERYRGCINETIHLLVITIRFNVSGSSAN
jgi:hypothetical protein